MSVSTRPYHQSFAALGRAALFQVPAATLTVLASPQTSSIPMRERRAFQ